MKCKCTIEVLKKMISLGDKVAHNSSSLYKEVGPFVTEEKAELLLKVIKEFTPREMSFFRERIKEDRVISPFYLSKINESYLIDCIMEVIKMLGDCNCDVELTKKTLQKFTNDLYIPLQIKHEELEEKYKKMEDDNKKMKEEIFNYKIENEESELENFIKELGADRGKIRELRNVYQQLIRISVNDSQDDVDELEDKIEIIRDDLVDKGISIVDAKKLCQKCEKIAKLKLERDNLYKERFEARQEVIL